MKVSLMRRLWVTFSANLIGFYASFINNFIVTGAENIPRSGGTLLAANHISAYETIFLPWAVIRSYPLSMLWAPAKEELFAKALSRWLYSSWGAFPVRRGRDIRAGRAINELLADQRVMLFPEGTRHRDGRLGKGNRGVGKIIYDVRPAVVPTALIGLNRWKSLGFRQKGMVVFGKPIDFSDLFQREESKETHQLIVDRVMDAIAELLEKEGAYAGRC